MMSSEEGIINDSDHQGYIIRPEIYNRFRPSRVREIVREILKKNLEDVKYEYEKMAGSYYKLISRKSR